MSSSFFVNFIFLKVLKLHLKSDFFLEILHEDFKKKHVHRMHNSLQFLPICVRSLRSTLILIPTHSNEKCCSKLFFIKCIIHYLLDT